MKFAVFTLGQVFKFSVEGKSDEEIYTKALPMVEALQGQGENVIMYVNNNIERIWKYKKEAA